MKPLNSFRLSGTILSSHAAHGRGVIVIGTTENGRGRAEQQTYEIYIKDLNIRNDDMGITNSLYKHVVFGGHMEYINEHYKEGVHGDVKLVADYMYAAKRFLYCALEGDNEAEISETMGCGYEDENIFYMNGTVTFIRAYPEHNFLLAGIRTRTSMTENRTSIITVAASGRAGRLLGTAKEGDEVLVAGVITKRNNSNAPGDFSLFCRDVEFLSYADTNDKEENGAPVEENTEADNTFGDEPGETSASGVTESEADPVDDEADPVASEEEDGIREL